MQRIRAVDYYFFNDDYFEALKQLLERRGWLLVAEQEGAWVAAALFLKGGEYMHYHLSATDPDRKVPGATNAIIAVATRIGTEAGLKRLHLGGGRTRTADDALLKSKNRWPPIDTIFKSATRPECQRSHTFATFGERRVIQRHSNSWHRFLCYKEKPANSSDLMNHRNCL